MALKSNEIAVGMYSKIWNVYSFEPRNLHSFESNSPATITWAREKKNFPKTDGLSKITLSGANRWQVSTHHQQKNLTVPKSLAADSSLAGVTPSSVLQGSVAALNKVLYQHRLDTSQVSTQD